MLLLSVFLFFCGLAISSWRLAAPAVVVPLDGSRPFVLLWVACGRFGSGRRRVRVPLPRLCGVSRRVAWWVACAWVRSLAGRPARWVRWFGLVRVV